jgi:hypothetical protein
LRRGSREHYHRRVPQIPRWRLFGLTNRRLANPHRSGSPWAIPSSVGAADSRVRDIEVEDEAVSPKGERK